MSLRSTPINKSKKSLESPPTLQQYRIDEPYSPSSGSEIEICVEAILMPATEDLCCDLLQRKYIKAKFFAQWKLRFQSKEVPNFSDDEISGLKAQSDRNASHQYRRERTRFIIQYATVALFSLQRFQLGRSFSHWIDKFNQSRLEKLQNSVSTAFYRRKLLEKSLHSFRAAVFRESCYLLSSANKNASQIASSDKLLQINQAIKETEQINQQLETDIQTKTDKLKDLQLNLQFMLTEGQNSEKQLRQITLSTDQLQTQLQETEKRYQDEIASLRAQLALNQADPLTEITRLSQELQQQNNDREAANAFAGDAETLAQAELAQSKDKLIEAEKIVADFQDLYERTEQKVIKLREQRQALQQELENLQLRRSQLQSSTQAKQITSHQRITKMTEMLVKVQSDTRNALQTIESQKGMIRNKQKEIKLLEDEINRLKAKYQATESRFLSGLSPRRPK